jgi:hypothetical protein
MDKKLANRIWTLKSLRAIITTNKEKLSRIPDLKRHVETFENLMDQLVRKGEAVTSTSKGQARTKKEAKDRLLNVLEPLKMAFTSFAYDRGLHTVLDKVLIPQSSLRRMREPNLLQACTLILEEMEDHKAELAACDVTEEEIAEYREAVLSFDNAMSSKISSVSTRLALRNTEDHLVKEVESLLSEKMDGLIDKLKKTEPELWAAYFHARPTKKFGLRHKPPVEEQPSPPPDATQTQVSAAPQVQAQAAASSQPTEAAR